MSKLREILGELGLRWRFQCAVVDELEEISSDVYALKENRKLKDEAIKQLQADVRELRRILGKQVTRHE